MLSREDMEKLIVVSDQLVAMNKCFEQLCGGNYENGAFCRIDELYDVMFRNAASVFGNSKECETDCMELFYRIILNSKLTVEERAKMVMVEV